MAVLDRFNGSGNLESWIYRAEKYFTYLGFSEKDWLPLPYFYLDGEALAWFTWLHRNKQFFDWTHFKEKLRIRFGQRAFTDSVSREDTSRAGVDYVSYNPAFPQPISAAPVANLSHDPNSSDLEAAFNNGNSQEVNVFDNLSNRADKCDSRELPSSVITSSKTIPLTPEHSGVVLYLEETRKSEEVSAPLIIEESTLDFNVDKGLSSPVDKPEVLHESVNPLANSSNSLHFPSLVVSFGCTGTSNTPLGTKNVKEEHLRNYTCKVFAEITDKKIDMNDEDSVQKDSVKPETQVVYKVFQTVAAACGHDQHIGRGAFDYLSVLGYAKLILSLHPCPPDQFKLCFPFDPGSSLFAAFLGTTRNDIYCGALSILNYDKFRTLTLWNSCISPLELQFKRTNRVCTYVFLALGLVSLVRHMWMGRSYAPLKETDLERVYMFELEKATQWKGLEFFLIGEKDYGLGLIFYSPRMIDVTNSELIMLLSNIVAHFGRLEITDKTMPIAEATNKANYHNTVSIRRLGKSMVEKVFADNSNSHSPSDLDNIANGTFRTEISFKSYIHRAIIGRGKTTLSSGKVSGNVFPKYYASGGLREGNNIFLSCAISDMFSIRGAWLIFVKMAGKSLQKWNVIDAYTPYGCTERAVECLEFMGNKTKKPNYDLRIFGAIVSLGSLMHLLIMLREFVKRTYCVAKIENHISLRSLVILFVDVGSGILSLIVVQAGAKHVSAVEASQMVAYAQKFTAENSIVKQFTAEYSIGSQMSLFIVPMACLLLVAWVLYSWQSSKRKAESQNSLSSSSKSSTNTNHISSSMLPYLNLEDKVLIEDGSIVMNQPQPNIGLRRIIGPRRSQGIGRPLKRLNWDPGP